MENTPQSKLLFPTQRSDEHVIMMLRRHWIIWARFILILIAFNVVPILVFVFLFFFVQFELAADGPIFVGVTVLLSLYYLIAWLIYFHQFLDYRLDLWILTDQRIINIEQEGLFSRIISELNISKVQDVTSEVHGHLETLLDYGHVYIQTAGERQRFVFEMVPHPEEVARLVIKANDAAVKRQNEQLNQQAPLQPATLNQQTEPAPEAQPMKPNEPAS